MEVEQWFQDQLLTRGNEQDIIEAFDARVIGEYQRNGQEITSMVSDAQIKFFDKLLEEKDFGPKVDKEKLRKEFSTLSSKSASLWIERAMALSKRDDSNDPIVEPSF